MKKLKKEKTKTNFHKSEEISYTEHLPHFRRIEDQVRGLQEMIDTKRECLETIHQISSVINHLRRVQNDMLHEHLATLGEMILVEDLSSQRRREIADEISKHLKRLS